MYVCVVHVTHHCSNKLLRMNIIILYNTMTIVYFCYCTKFKTKMVKIRLKGLKQIIIHKVHESRAVIYIVADS